MENLLKTHDELLNKLVKFNRIKFINHLFPEITEKLKYYVLHNLFSWKLIELLQHNKITHIENLRVDCEQAYEGCSKLHFYVLFNETFGPYHISCYQADIDNYEALSFDYKGDYIDKPLWQFTINAINSIHNHEAITFGENNEYSNIVIKLNENLTKQRNKYKENEKIITGKLNELKNFKFWSEKLGITEIVDPDSKKKTSLSDFYNKHLENLV